MARRKHPGGSAHPETPRDDLFTRAAEERVRKLENVRELLGEKETVAYAALLIGRDGLTDDPTERKLVLDALLLAGLLKGSDRAQAMVFWAIT